MKTTLVALLIVLAGPAHAVIAWETDRGGTLRAHNNPHLIIRQLPTGAELRCLDVKLAEGTVDYLRTVAGTFPCN